MINYVYGEQLYRSSSASGSLSKKLLHAPNTLMPPATVVLYARLSFCRSKKRTAFRLKLINGL
ncbi:hypothetical protein MYEC719_p30102 (plasmid) [Escherichia coli]|nr:hypothetical protein MYEC719_p30102 [Escherichia coli]